MADGECVKVIVRCRPMNTREKDLNCKCCLTMEGSRGQCAIKNPGDPKAPPKLFTFDGAYFTDSTTESIYNEIAYPLVEGVTEGYNGTIFAYGQTGCGKSFTMQGITDPATQRGVIPRSFDHIFETVSVSEEMKFLLHASYCEIYNEEIRDLLGKDIKTKLDLKEHPEKGVYVNGLSMHPVHNVHDCEKIMSRGWSNRATGATLMNADSSRSHSIFTINIEMCSTDEEGEDHIRAGKLNLVDLAGSERQAKTGATGDRLKEATKINLSLSALGNVISALVDGKSKHIPYRDSKLTRLLQDSLGGNTKTLMVACLSPADNNYEETLSTLRYANRAKNIQNKPKINEDPKDALLRQYQEEIQKLKAMLLGQIPVSGIESTGGLPTQSSQGDDLSREDLEHEKERIRDEYDNKLSEMKAEYEREKADKGKIQQDMLKLRAFYDTKLSSVDGQIAGLPPTAAGKSKTKPAKSKKVLKIDDQDFMPNGFETNQQVKVQDGQVVATQDGQVVVTQDGQVVATQDGQVIATQGGQQQNNQQQNGEMVAAAVATETVINPDGTKVIYKTVTNTEYINNTEYVEVEKPGNQTEGPQSVSGDQLPSGPDAKAIRMQNVSDEAGNEEVTAIIVGGAPVLEQEGMVAPSSSPTQSNMQEQLKLHQEEAMRRLQELEKQMVGGENKDNKAVKDRRRKRIKFADERKARLAEAIANMDDDFILLQIYDETQQEVKDKDSEVRKEQLKVESLEREIIDIQSEFQFDRIDYLDTIRKQEKQIKLLEALLDKIHPCLRRDCNYANLDRIKMDCKFEEDEEKWILPRMMIQTTSLPVAEGIMPGARTMDPRQRRSINGDIQASHHDNDEDRFREKIMRKSDNSNNYFQGKRASQLLQSKEPITKFNINEVKDTYTSKLSPRISNGHSHHDMEPMSKGLRAAAVHGQLLQEDNMVRRPTRLEALPAVGRKGKKKKNALEPL